MPRADERLQERLRQPLLVPFGRPIAFVDQLSAQAGPLKELPAGVSGYVGWANRLLFATTYLWVSLAALSVLRART